MNSLPLDDLLLGISYSDTDATEANKYFKILFQRYEPTLKRYLYHLAGRLPGLDPIIIDDIVDHTFLQIYRKPLDFVHKDSANEEDIDKLFKAYISRIAKNRFLDLMKKKKANNEVNLIDVKGEDFEPGIDDELLQETDSENVQLLKKALDSLNQKHKEILLTLYALSGGSRTPKDTRMAMEKQFATTWDNIRQIKSRSEKKIKSFILEHGKIKQVRS